VGANASDEDPEKSRRFRAATATSITGTLTSEPDILVDEPVSFPGGNGEAYQSCSSDQTMQVDARIRRAAALSSTR
jgi:hypothetical protein